MLQAEVNLTDIEGIKTLLFDIVFSIVSFNPPDDTCLMYILTN